MMMIMMKGPLAERMKKAAGWDGLVDARGSG